MNRNALFSMLVGSLVMGLGACRTPAPVPATPEPVGEPAAEVEFFSDTRADVPAEPLELRTTNGDIYLNNLNARIRSLREAVEQRTGAWRLRVLLADALAHRGRVLGQQGDLEDALVQVNTVLSAQPDNSAALLARAGLYSAFHRFEDALADLEHAERAGLKGEPLAMARAGVLVALGKTARAEALAEPWLDQNLTDLAFRANRLVDEGKLEAADRLFSKAQAVYDDTNPVALSWLHVQHGVAFLRNRLLERAREFFRAAHLRLPRYYLAAEHLAETEYELGNFARAAELYRQVSEQTGIPVFYAKLAEAQRALGNPNAARAAEAKARAGFEAWLDEHPEAAWQHAAEYYLSRDEAGKAVALARFNAGLHHTIAGLLLLAQAEQAAGNPRAACEAWGEALQTAAENALNPPEIAQNANAFVACDPP